MELTDLSDGRTTRRNGVIRFTRAQADARSKARRVLNGKDAAYNARPGVREARNATTNQWQRANPDKVIASYRRWEQKKGPLGLLLHQIRRGAKARGLEFSITEADFPVLPTHCPVLGIELSYVGASGINPRAISKMVRASIDRKDNSKGYVPGNVFIISFRANQLKSDGTAVELRALANWMEK
jgi:hypothetical protein